MVSQGKEVVSRDGAPDKDGLPRTFGLTGVAAQTCVATARQSIVEMSLVALSMAFGILRGDAPRRRY